jgi:hypothetical protein
MLQPAEAVVEVRGEPRLDLRFSQLRLRASGQVECAQAPCPALSLVLHSLDRDFRLEPVPLCPAPGHPPSLLFDLPDLLPGRYRLEPHADRPLCFEPAHLDFEVIKSHPSSPAACLSLLCSLSRLSSCVRACVRACVCRCGHVRMADV